jgi:hypothetical protein
MLVDRTGVDEGRSWPGPGGETDVPDDLGAAMCAHGWAAPVARLDADVETREDPQEVQAAVQEAAEDVSEPVSVSAVPKPAPSDPKGAWVAHAVAQGYSEADAASMTKSDLIAALGG